MYKCFTKKSKEYKKYWLNLPKLLYTKEENPQNYKIEKQILEGCHPLSKDIEVYPYVILNYKNEIICRCLLTYYKNDTTGYIGFFESKNEIKGVKLLFKLIEEKAKKDKKEKLLGPVDASIYINYRFKTNLFDKTYTGEPYNKDYYQELWEQCGFTISDNYYSYKLRRVEEKDNNETFNRILKRYEKQGYEFITPNKESFQKVIEDVYPLLINRYSNFVAYKKISIEQFKELFTPLKNILNFNMVKLVYKNNELFAFCICIPNYKTLTRGKITLSKILKINKIKKNPEEYIILYLGASEKTIGLGTALIQVIRNELLNNKCTSIAALIHEGNTPEIYYDDLHIEKYKYCLYSKNLT